MEMFTFAQIQFARRDTPAWKLTVDSLFVKHASIHINISQAIGLLAAPMMGSDCSEASEKKREEDASLESDG